MTFHDRPWPDLVDGELRERALPTLNHGWLQFMFCRILTDAGLLAVPELHLKLGGGDYNVADVAAYPAYPGEQRPSTPPLVVVEVLSPDDRLRDVLSKAQEYQDWGVPNIWIVDPNLWELRVYRNGDLVRVDALELPEYRVRVGFDDLKGVLPSRVS